MASKKIFVSWFSSSSKAPMPSESISSNSSYQPLKVPCSGLVHSQSPLVHGFIVGPTPNPPYLVLMSTRFSKNDFPVRYLPATAITPTWVLIWDRKHYASLVTRYFSIISIVGWANRLTSHRVELYEVNWLVLSL